MQTQVRCQVLYDHMPPHLAATIVVPGLGALPLELICIKLSGDPNHQPRDKLRWAVRVAHLCDALQAYPATLEVELTSSDRWPKEPKLSRDYKDQRGSIRSASCSRGSPFPPHFGMQKVRRSRICRICVIGLGVRSPGSSRAPGPIQRGSEVVPALREPRVRGPVVRTPVVG